MVYSFLGVHATVQVRINDPDPFLNVTVYLIHRTSIKQIININN